MTSQTLQPNRHITTDYTQSFKMLSKSKTKSFKTLINRTSITFHPFYTLLEDMTLKFQFEKETNSILKKIVQYLFIYTYKYIKLIFQAERYRLLPMFFPTQKNKKDSFGHSSIVFDSSPFFPLSNQVSRYSVNVIPYIKNIPKSRHC